MNRGYTFGCRLNEQEQELLEDLAERLQRTPSDTVRLLIREAAAGLAKRTGSVRSKRTAAASHG